MEALESLRYFCGIYFSSAPCGNFRFGGEAVDTVIAVVGPVIALIVMVFLLVGFVSLREGRVMFLLLSLIWGFGKWTWKDLQQVALGKMGVDRLLIPLILSVLLGIVYHMIRARVNAIQIKHLGLAGWGVLSLLIATRNPVAAILFMLVCDPGLVLSDLDDRCKELRKSSLAVLYWITIATTEGRDEFSAEVMFLLGLINFSVTIAPKVMEWVEAAPDSAQSKKGRLKQRLRRDTSR
jgi:hypothetical protein